MSIIESWTVSNQIIPYDVTCKLHQENQRLIGIFEAYPMDDAVRSEWYGRINAYDDVKGVSTNTKHHIGEYHVALKTTDVDDAKMVIKDMVNTMMWIIYPHECRQNYYENQ